MKRVFAISLGVFAALVLVVSCNKVNQDIPGGKDPSTPETPAVQQRIICATLSDVLTKVGFDPAYDASGKPTGLALTWATGDMIRVYDHADRTKYDDFILDSASDGQKKGAFTFTGESNLSGATSFDAEIICGDITYNSQSQPSDGVTTNLKYFASASGIADYASIEFTEFSSVLAITAKMPSTEVAAGIMSIDITASSDIFNGGNSLTIRFDEADDAGNDGILHFFAILPQGNVDIAAGTSLIVHFNAPGTAHSVYTRYIELPAGSFTANKCNTININATQTDTHAGAATCDGSSEAKAYLIGDKYQMQAMRGLMKNNVTTYFKLIDDIDLNSEDWEPLNYDNSFLRGLYFDGQGYTVKNLVSYGSGVAPEGHNGYAYPSFSGVLNGTIKSVTFDGVTISAGNNKAGAIGGYIGTSGIVGLCEKVIVNDVTVSGTNYIGGFVGQVGNASDSFLNCHVSGTSTITQNYGTSNSERSTGGFAGHASTTASYIGCSVTATVKQGDGKTINAIGGFIGKADGGVSNFTNCKVLGGSSVSGHSNIGGFIGYSAKASVFEACQTAANVTGDGIAIGGFIGLSAGGSFTGTRENVNSKSTCRSEGNVIGTGAGDAGSGVGGFVGNVTGGSFTCCDATGTVTSDGINVGGFVGASNGDISYSYCRYWGTKVVTTCDSPNDVNLGGFCGGISSVFTGSFSKCWVSQGSSGLSVKSSENKQRVGGFIGSIGTYAGASNTGIIEKCRVHKATITGGTYTGGFAGVSGISYSLCCVTGGSVTAAGYAVGGFVGYQRTDSGARKEIRNCYVTVPTVKSTNNNRVGGMTGYSKNTAYTNCYVGAVTIQFKADSDNNGSFIGRAEGSLEGFNQTLGCISWSGTTSLPWFGYGDCPTAESSYHKKADSDTYISTWATSFSWDTEFWNIPNNSNSVTLKETETIM